MTGSWLEACRSKFRSGVESIPALWQRCVFVGGAPQEVLRLRIQPAGAPKEPRGFTGFSDPTATHTIPISGSRRLQVNHRGKTNLVLGATM